MIKNSKRRYVVISYIVLLTFFVSILYYGRIHHFGQISTGNETIIGLKPVNDKKKNEVKEDFRNIVSEENDYVGSSRVLSNLRIRFFSSFPRT